MTPPQTAATAPAATPAPASTPTPGPAPTVTPAAGVSSPSATPAAPAAGGGAPASLSSGLRNPPFKPRPDPFAHFPPPPEEIRRQRVEPPPLIAVASLPRITHKTGYAAEAHPSPAGGGPEPREPGQRMAGVLWNGQVWAILERDGSSYIVKPGDSVGEARVHAIGRAEMVVADATGRHDVDLRGLAVAAPAAAPGPTPTAYGQPSLPAWQPTYGQETTRTQPATTGGRARRGHRFEE